MKISKRLILAIVFLMATTATAFYQNYSSAPDLVETANRFLAALDEPQLAKAKFDFAADDRFKFKFTPGDRTGLPLKEMGQHQRDLVYAMMAATLSQRGFIKASTIMSLEEILRVAEGAARGAGGAGGGGGAGRGGQGGGGQGRGGGQGAQGGQARGGFQPIVRDPELYYVSVFGQPSMSGTWGWKVEGHHVAVNITMNNGKIVSGTPTFLGSNPAEVRDGPRKGLRVLAREEDLARDLLMALDANQKKTAVFEAKALPDIVTGENREAKMGAPVGLQASKMNSKQVQMLTALLEEYAYRLSPDVAAEMMNQIKKDGIGKLYFAWAGSEKRGDAHYYRVQGPDFVVEYDNTQNQANHIHSVWRDLKNDFGVDTLRQHYKTAHLPGSAHVTAGF
jgi:hypothetical protein